MRDFAHVGFVYSQACPLKCDFCCHTIENVGRGRFRPASVIPVILDFSQYSSVRRFVFTGGEPFLFINEIFEILYEIRERKVNQPVHIVTSGNWAKSQAETDEIISKLCRLGMDSIWISYDHEHARFVPVENIKFIANSCQENKIPMKVQGVFWHQSERVEDLLKGPEFTNVQMSSTPVASIGEARINWKKRGQDFKLPDSDRYSCGAPKVYNLAIYPDGEAFPCCAGGFQKEAKLSTGNVFKNSAKEILDQTFGLFHARIAKEIGFDKLYNQVSKLSPELLSRLPNFSTASTVCEICRDIHSNNELMDALKPVYESMEIEYALGRVEKFLKAQEDLITQ